MTDFDPVNKPAHYNDGEIECIDAMRSALTDEEFRGGCKMQAMQYIWRERLKGGDQDLQKAVWWLRMASGDDPREYRNQKLAGWPAQRPVPICKLCGLPANSGTACYNERCPG